MLSIRRRPLEAAVESAIIDIRVQRIDQLFDSLDPSPFREKALDREFEAYLRDCANEHGSAVPLCLRLHVPVALLGHRTDIEQAIHSHFRFTLEQAERRARGRRRRYRGVVLMGFIVLAASLLLGRLLEQWPGYPGAVLTEGLLVLGWVALWRPIEALLFDRHEAREEQAMLHQLATVPLQWQQDDPGGGTALGAIADAASPPPG
jgi:hypothetical protein